MTVWYVATVLVLMAISSGTVSVLSGAAMLTVTVTMLVAATLGARRGGYCD